MVKRPPSNRLLRRLNRRQRKKLRVGEFRELVFEVDIVFAHPLGDDEYDDFIASFVEFAGSRGLCIGGFGGRSPLAQTGGIVAAPDGHSATEDDRAALEQWLRQQALVRNAVVGELVDGWYGDLAAPSGKGHEAAAGRGEAALGQDLILFLDFDGVLHPQEAQQEQLFTRTPLLEALLREHLTVRVVISSSWREIFDLPALREHFSPDIAARIIDVTPVRVTNEQLPGPLWSYVREGECWAWMHRNRPEGTPWIALDDQAWRFSPQCPQLVLTDPAVGLDAWVVERLGQLMANNVAGSGPGRAADVGAQISGEST